MCYCDTNRTPPPLPVNGHKVQQRSKKKPGKKKIKENPRSSEEAGSIRISELKWRWNKLARTSPESRFDL